MSPGLYSLHGCLPLIRGYAAWAPGRIGNLKAKSVLESRLKREDSKYVKTEIETALAN